MISYINVGKQNRIFLIYNEKWLSILSLLNYKLPLNPLEPLTLFFFFIIYNWCNVYRRKVTVYFVCLKLIRYLPT